MESLQAVAGISSAGVGTATGGTIVMSGTAAKTSSGVETVTSKLPITVTATSEVAGEATTEAATQTSAGLAASGTAKAGAVSGGGGIVAVVLSAVSVLGAVIML